MLLRLSITNYALINHLELTPASGLNIITGETGAGKSIILGALGLLLGNRADTSVLLNNDKKCVVEAEFNITNYGLQALFEENEIDYEENTIIRREVSPRGKSRAFINDTPINLAGLKQIINHLMDVHSQHDTLKLGSNQFQLNVIDALAENEQLIKTYDQQYKKYLDAKKEYESLIEWQKQYQKEIDYDRHLLSELDEADLQENEQEQLEEEQKMLENAEEIKLKLQTALQLLSQEDTSVSSLLSEILSNIHKLTDYSENFANLSQRIESVQIELRDIENELAKEEEKTEHNPQRLEEINERISLIYRLQQKHQVFTLSELLKIQTQLKEKLEKADNLDEEIKEKENILNEAYNELEKYGNELSHSREKIFEYTEKNIKELLNELGMPNASFKVQNDKGSFGSHGKDNITFLFSANKGIEPQNLSNVASGGEFSRLMLALKYIMANKVSLPTIIFDEIDTGISGSIAIKVGNIMQNMAENHQLITITHLPQIAARGDKHYNVYKDETEDRTVSKIDELSEEERLTAIARMIGGDNPGNAAYENAKELIEQQKKTI